MTDIRSRHVMVTRHDWRQPGSDTRCDSDGQDWPCDAIREADRADKAEAALAESQQRHREAISGLLRASEERDEALEMK